MVRNIKYYAWKSLSDEKAKNSDKTGYKSKNYVLTGYVFI